MWKLWNAWIVIWPCADSSGTRLPDSFRLHPVEFTHVLDVVEADGKVDDP